MLLGVLGKNTMFGKRVEENQNSRNGEDKILEYDLQRKDGRRSHSLGNDPDMMRHFIRLLTGSSIEDLERNLFYSKQLRKIGKGTGIQLNSKPEQLELGHAKSENFSESGEKQNQVLIQNEPSMDEFQFPQSPGLSRRGLNRLDRMDSMDLGEGSSRKQLKIDNNYLDDEPFGLGGRDSPYLGSISSGSHNLDKNRSLKMSEFDPDAEDAEVNSILDLKPMNSSVKSFGEGIQNLGDKKFK